jgi:sugar phosphate isomerase/epimerase
LCLEPNPPAYGCDWVTEVAHAVQVVDAVGSAGFGVHLDTAAMTLAGESADAVRAVGLCCRHFHLSAPFLHEFPGVEVGHAEFAAALEQVHYRGWVSIEMSEAKLQPPWQDAIGRALAFAGEVYGRAAGGPAASLAG